MDQLVKILRLFLYSASRWHPLPMLAARFLICTPVRASFTRTLQLGVCPHPGLLHVTMSPERGQAGFAVGSDEGVGVGWSLPLLLALVFPRRAAAAAFPYCPACLGGIFGFPV